MAISPRRPRVASPRRMIEELAGLRTRFGPEERARKRDLLGELSRTELLHPGLLYHYHEALLFLLAYPDDAGIRRLARAECARFAGRCAALGAKSRRALARLDDTGIAGTSIHYQYEYETVRHLEEWFGSALDIDWKGYPDTAPLDALLPLLADAVETDGLDATSLSAEEWLKLAGGRESTGLQLVLRGLKNHRASPAVTRALYDGLELPVTWNLGKSRASRTAAAARGFAPFFQTAPLRRQIPDLEEEVRRPLPPLAPLSGAAGKRMIFLVRTALAVRHRGLYPIEHASPREVLLASTDRGYAIVLFGMLPENRLPLESDFGALILKNGLPIGYGVGAVLFEQAEIALNIFDTWRGGESAFVFSQFLRAFHRQFGCTRFRIERYQIGHDNPEGLLSGSFWFYYKLGFRPRETEVRRLAETEAARRRDRPGYRTPLSILKKLARSDLFLSLKGGPPAEGKQFPLGELGLKVTGLIGSKYSGDSKRAREECGAAVAARLGLSDRSRWPADERLWFDRLALMVCQIPALEGWPEGEKSALAGLMRAKGGAGEADYARRLAAASRLKRALFAVAGP